MDVPHPRYSEMWFGLCGDPGSHPKPAGHCLNNGLANKGEAYAESDGTSFATPLVAGVAALMMARAPTLTPQEIKAILQSTARHIAPFYAKQNGLSSFGVLDAKKALEMAIAMAKTRGGGK